MSLDIIRNTYTSWAPIYNATHAWTLPGRRAARLALGIQPGDRVLDLACGTGLNFLHLRQLVGDRGSIVGVDLTPAMLEAARRVILAQGWKNVEVFEADAAQLPFPDLSFDKAICTFALNIIPDYVRAIAEVRRVLVPGGKFAALEMRLGFDSLPRWLQVLPHICGVDITHRTLDELKRLFGDVLVNHYWRGMIFLAIVVKESSHGLSL